MNCGRPEFICKKGGTPEKNGAILPQGLIYSSRMAPLAFGTGCMRKFAVTTFAVLYGILVLFISAERFNDWVAQEAVGHSRFVSGQHCPGFGKAEKSETYLRSKRIV